MRRQGRRGEGERGGGGGVCHLELTKTEQSAPRNATDQRVTPMSNPRADNTPPTHHTSNRREDTRSNTEPNTRLQVKACSSLATADNAVSKLTTAQEDNAVLNRAQPSNPRSTLSNTLQQQRPGKRARRANNTRETVKPNAGPKQSNAERAHINTVQTQKRSHIEQTQSQTQPTTEKLRARTHNRRQYHTRALTTSARAVSAQNNTQIPTRSKDTRTDATHTCATADKHIEHTGAHAQTPTMIKQQRARQARSSATA